MAIDISKIKWSGGSSEPEQQVDENPVQQVETAKPEVNTESQPEQQPEPEREQPGDVSGQPEPAGDPVPEWKGKFNSPDDLWAAYNELAGREPEVKEVEKVVEKPMEFEDERLKELVEFYNSGGDLTKYLEARAVNYDNYADEDILRLEYEKKYPTLSKGDVDILFRRHLEKQYGIGDDADDSEMQAAKIQMKADASLARKALKDEQAKFQLPEPKQVATNEGPTEEEIRKQHQEWVESIWSNPVAKAYDEAKSITVKHGDGEFNYKVKDWDKVKGITESDGAEFFNLFSTGDKGNPIDFDKWFRVMAYATDPEGYEKALIAHGKNIGSEGVVEEITNPGRPDPKPAGVGPKNWVEAALKGIEANKRK